MVPELHLFVLSEVRGSTQSQDLSQLRLWMEKKLKLTGWIYKRKIKRKEKEKEKEKKKKKRRKEEKKTKKKIVCW